MIKQLYLLKNNSGFLRYFKNSAWMIGEQFVRIIAGLLVGIWVARYLGPADFGVFNYVIAITTIFASFAKLGLDDIMVRDLLIHSEKRDSYLGTAFWLKFFGAIVLIFLMAVALTLTSNDASTNLLIIIAGSGLVFSSFEVVGFYFQSQVQAKIISICKVIQLLLSTLIKIFLIVTGSSLIYFVFVLFFDTLTLAVAYWVAYRMRERRMFFRCFDKSIGKQMLKDAWPLLFSAVVVVIYMRIDQIMIRELLGVYELGVYSAAVRLSEAFYFIPLIITASLFPAIINAKRQSEELYKTRLQRLYKFMVWGAVSIALVTNFLGDWIVLSLFGQAYQEASSILIVHIWASIFVFLGVASSKWFVTENLQRLNLMNTVVGGILNIILNLMLIPKFGMLGAAYATLISQTFASYLLTAIWKESRPNFYMLSKGFF